MSICLCSFPQKHIQYCNKRSCGTQEHIIKMINIAGVVSIVLFYLLILGVGIWAGRKKEAGNDSEEEVMLAGRSIGLFVGIFTMTGK